MRHPAELGDEEMKEKLAGNGRRLVTNGGRHRNVAGILRASGREARGDAADAGSQ